MAEPDRRPRPNPQREKAENPDAATTNTAKLVTESILIPSADAGIQLYLREKMPNVLAGVDLAREEAYRTMLAQRFPFSAR